MKNSMTEKLTHFDASGYAHMVDVGGKKASHRVAMAVGEIEMNYETFEVINNGVSRKGDVIGVARIAAIQAAKKTSDLIPLCHPIFLSRVTVNFEFKKSNDLDRPVLVCTATAETVGVTGVEMEALTAVQIGLLTVYDMCKAIDKGMKMQNIFLIEKHGGKSGSYYAPS
jgi:cyclic pyranopterin monophosphate synthase